MNVARLLNMTLPFVPCSFTVNPARVAACERMGLCTGNVERAVVVQPPDSTNCSA